MSDSIRLIFLLALLASPAWAQSAPVTDQSLLQALKAQVEALAARVEAQEEELNRLRRESTDGSAITSPAPSSPPSRSSLSAFNPDIGVVADIVAKLTESDEDRDGNDKISVREIEIVFGHDVDPYSRFDAAVAFSDFDGVHLEEAYLTHWGLPLDTSGRLGRFRPRIGLAASMHRDALETVDEPFVVAEYFGDEGFSRTGIELSNFLPTPWDSPAHEIVFGVLEGGTSHGGTVFGSSGRQPTFYARLRNSLDLGDDAFEFGSTYMNGASDRDGDQRVHVVGLDLRYDYHFNPLQRLRLQGEAYLQDREGAFELDKDDHGHEHRAEHSSSRHAEHHVEEDHHDAHAQGSDVLFRRSPYGAYALADLRLSTSYAIGVRYDYVEPVNAEGLDAEEALSGYFTFFQSEFARWRFQYQHVDLAEGGHDDRFFLQGTFAIGVHKHQIQ